VKKRSLQLLTILALSLSLTACGKDESSDAPASGNAASDISADVQVEAEATEEEEENHDGMYRSELTNEWIDESLKDQRPIAVMVDNESSHYHITVLPRQTLCTK